jgi:hypothetical protein
VQSTRATQDVDQRIQVVASASASKQSYSLGEKIERCAAGLDRYARVGEPVHRHGVKIAVPRLGLPKVDALR